MWDVFISHASEDKNDLARPLVKLLEAEGLSVWFDEQEIVLGDSLREKIDEGLSKSKWGVVIISHHFLEKNWPQAELDTIILRTISEKNSILPVWHNISAGDIAKKSPLLAARLGIETSRGLNEVCAAIVRAIKKNSTNTITSKRESSHQSLEFWFESDIFKNLDLLKQPNNPLLGLWIGNYRLEKFIGAGGTGAVFRATNTILGKTGALKLFYPLKPDFQNITMATERSIRGLSNLRYPTIAEIYDYGYVSSGTHNTVFLVYELVNGLPLHLWSWSYSMRNDPNAFIRRLEVSISITDALVKAHNVRFVGNLGFQEAGILHGDLKPTNILITKESSQPKIIDFMLPNLQQLILRDPETPSTNWYKSDKGQYQIPMTHDFGTPGFMPPEQAVDGIVTPASDIYALGRTFIYLFFRPDDVERNENISESVLHLDAQKKLGDFIMDKMYEPQPNNRLQKMSDVYKWLKLLYEEVK